MKRFAFVFFLLGCSFLSTSIIAQSAKQNLTQTKTAYYYSFEGVKSLSDIENLKTDIFALRGVTEFKPVFKPENNIGQCIVVVTEKVMTSEGDKLFNITDLKKIIENHGFTPHELTIVPLPVK